MHINTRGALSLLYLLLVISCTCVHAAPSVKHFPLVPVASGDSLRLLAQDQLQTLEIDLDPGATFAKRLQLCQLQLLSIIEIRFVGFESESFHLVRRRGQLCA